MLSYLLSHSSPRIPLEMPLAGACVCHWFRRKRPPHQAPAVYLAIRTPFGAGLLAEAASSLGCERTPNGAGPAEAIPARPKRRYFALFLATAGLTPLMAPSA